MRSDNWLVGLFCFGFFLLGNICLYVYHPINNNPNLNPIAKLLALFAFFIDVCATMWLVVKIFSLEIWSNQINLDKFDKFDKK